MPALITRDLVTLDADLGPERSDVIRALATLVVDAGRATEVDSLYADAWAREQKTDTGLGGGIAIPHCRSASVTEPTLAFARVSPKVDFGGFDGPADIVFMIAAPAGGDELHLQLLAKLARSLVNEDFVAALRSAATPDEIVALVGEATADAPAAAPAAAAAADRRSGARRRHLLRHGHRPHVHGGRRADERREEARRRAAHRDAGVGGHDPARPCADRQGRGRDLRERRRRARPRPLRRQTGRAGARQARHRSPRGHGPGGARRREGPERGPRAGRRRRLVEHGAGDEPGSGDQADPAHGRQLHDPVRRGRRPADRDRLPARRDRVGDATGTRSC